MINTIFYFAESYDEYMDRLTNEGIDARTICLINNQDGTGSIYRAGIPYGGTNYTELKTLIQQFIDNGDLIPFATDETPGVIKLGNGLSVLFNEDGTTDGTVYVNCSDIPNLTQYIVNAIISWSGYTGEGGPSDSLPKASYEKYGIVKISENNGIIQSNGELSLDFSKIASKLSNKTDYQEFWNIVENTYNLPAATTTTLGGIIVGQFLSADSDGTLSINIDDLFSDTTVINKIKKVVTGRDGQDGQDGQNGIDGYIKEIVSDTKASWDDIFGVVAIARNGGLDVNDGVISINQDWLNATVNNLDYAITSFSTTEKGLSLTQTNGLNTTVDLTDVVKNIIDGWTSNPGETSPMIDYSITNLSTDGTVLHISLANQTEDKTTDLKDIVKLSITTLVNEGDTIIQQIGQKTEVSVNPEITSGTKIASITVDGTIKDLYTPSQTTGGSGSTVSVSRDVTSGTKIATITVDGVNNDLYAPTSSSTSGSTVSVTADLSSGTKLASITVDGSETNVYAPTVAVQQILSTGTHIATVTVGDTVTNIYAPSSNGGGSGTGGGTTVEEYDDTELWNAVNDLKDRADSTENDLDSILNRTEEDIRNEIYNAFNTYESLINYYIQKGDTTYTNYTFGNDDLNEWASQMGLIIDNGDGTYTVGWSSLQQTVNSLSATVSQLEANQSAGGEIDYDLLSSALYAYINENYTSSGMESTWANFVRKDDDSIQFLEWFHSDVTTYAEDGYTYSQLTASAKDYDDNKEVTQEAISAIQAIVEKDEDGNYVATTTMASMVEDLVNTSLSEVFTENSSNTAVAGLYARVKDAEDAADAATETANTASGAIAGIDARVVELEDAGYIAETNLAAAITNNKDEIISQSGLALKSDVTTAQSTLQSQIDLKLEQEDLNGYLQSGDLDGYVATNDLVSQITANKDTIISQAGLATSATVNEAETRLLSSIDGVSSTITTSCVRKDPNTNKVTSLITLTSDYVTIESDVIQASVNSAVVQAKDLISAEVIDDFNQQTGLTISNGNIKLQADHTSFTDSTGNDMIKVQMQDVDGVSIPSIVFYDESGAAIWTLNYKSGLTNNVSELSSGFWSSILLKYADISHSSGSRSLDAERVWADLGGEGGVNLYYSTISNPIHPEAFDVTVYKFNAGKMTVNGVTSYNPESAGQYDGKYYSNNTLSNGVPSGSILYGSGVTGIQNNNDMYITIYTYSNGVKQEETHKITRQDVFAIVDGEENPDGTVSAQEEVVAGSDYFWDDDQDMTTLIISF